MTEQQDQLHSARIVTESESQTVHGTAREIMDVVRQVLTDRISSNSKFIHEETEKVRSVGSLMSEKDEYYGILTIKLRIGMSDDEADDIVVPLKTLESSNTLSTRSKSSQFMQDYEEYYYTIDKSDIDAMLIK